ncbi:DNase I-like protein, partial [Meira miltonrushii]
LPRNLTIPDPLELSPKPEGSSRIASWNIISLKSSMGKGLIRYIAAEDADVVFLSETKCNDVPMILKEKYPHQTWGIGKTKGYAGVALLSKSKPIKVTSGLPGGDQDTKARLITAEFENHFICGTYVVNAGEKLKSMPAKVHWNERFAAHLAECDKSKPTIWTGDLNVVLDARDLSKASEKWNKVAGYTATECNHHRQVLAGTAVEGAKPYVDIWRERNPDAIGHFTYFGFRGQCRQKGIGWRLDSFIIPERIKDSVLDVGIRHTVYGASDHLPIYMDIKGAL